jgi:hypothetical protein
MQSDDILALLSAILLSRRDTAIGKADIELAVKNAQQIIAEVAKQTPRGKPAGFSVQG